MALYGRLFSLVRPSQFYVQTFETRLGRITEIPLYFLLTLTVNIEQKQIGTIGISSRSLDGSEAGASHYINCNKFLEFLPNQSTKLFVKAKRWMRMRYKVAKFLPTLLA